MKNIQASANTVLLYLFSCWKQNAICIGKNYLTCSFMLLDSNTKAQWRNVINVIFYNVVYHNLNSIRYDKNMANKQKEKKKYGEIRSSIVPSNLKRQICNRNSGVDLQMTCICSWSQVFENISMVYTVAYGLIFQMLLNICPFMHVFPKKSGMF